MACPRQCARPTSPSSAPHGLPGCRDYYDISVAVATPKGLVVPVLRDVDQMSFADVEKVSRPAWGGCHATVLDLNGVRAPWGPRGLAFWTVWGRKTEGGCHPTNALGFCFAMLHRK